MRSFLFVPGNNRRFLEKAATLDLDAAILDLEDAVPPDEKKSARSVVKEAVRPLAERDIDVYVRINSPSGELELDDMRATAGADLKGFVVPKIRGPEDLVRVDKILSSIEEEEGFPQFEILPLIESALGLVRAFDVALASPRVVALIFGAFDYSFDMGTNWSKEGVEYNFAREKIPIDARAAGISAIDSVYPDPNDEAGFAKDAELGKRLGYAGKTIIHPNQIAIANSTFSPSEVELERARRTVDAYEGALRQGRGAITLDGQLVDMVHYRRGKEILDLNELIRTRRPRSGPVRPKG